MESTIREIVDNFFKEKKLDIISEVERKIVKECGRNFINKHISQTLLRSHRYAKVRAKCGINSAARGVHRATCGL